MSETRKGKHKEGKTLFGAYVAPEVKALAELTSEVSGDTFTQIILDGITTAATRAGVMLNGRVVPEHKEAYDLLVRMTREKVANTKKGAK